MSDEPESSALQRLYDEAHQAYWAGDYPRALANLEVFTKASPDSIPGWIYLDRARALSADFADRLREADAARARRRIYILGCGRSGTWLAAAMMSCFADTFVLDHEAPVGRFLRLDASEPTHVIKREWCAYETAHLIPETVGLLYLIRFPLDVLVSRHVEQNYYIKPERWRQEIAALRLLTAQRRANLLALRYEDLVTRPDCEQKRVAAAFGLEPRIPFSRFPEVFVPSEFITNAMNGLRPPAPTSIGRWRSSPEYVAYCRALGAEIGEDVGWVCDRFGYEPPTLAEAPDETEPDRDD